MALLKLPKDRVPEIEAQSGKKVFGGAEQSARSADSQIWQVGLLDIELFSTSKSRFPGSCCRVKLKQRLYARFLLSGLSEEDASVPLGQTNEHLMINGRCADFPTDVPPGNDIENSMATVYGRHANDDSTFWGEKLIFCGGKSQVVKVVVLAAHKYVNDEICGEAHVSLSAVQARMESTESRQVDVCAPLLLPGKVSSCGLVRISLSATKQNGSTTSLSSRPGGMEHVDDCRAYPNLLRQVSNSSMSQVQMDLDVDDSLSIKGDPCSFVGECISKPSELVQMPLSREITGNTDCSFASCAEEDDKVSEISVSLRRNLVQAQSLPSPSKSSSCDSSKKDAISSQCKTTSHGVASPSSSQRFVKPSPRSKPDLASKSSLLDSNKKEGQCMTTSQGVASPSSSLRLVKPPPRSKSGNSNKPSLYGWIGSLLWRVSKGDASRVATLKSRPATPLFVVMGSCPNAFCGMQAMLYAAPDSEGDQGSPVDFWWIKPQKNNQDQLEENTLTLRSTGAHKNDPQRSRQAYQPLADWFNSADKENQKPSNPKRPTFELLKCSEGSAVRAVMRLDGDPQPLYLLYVWQEQWGGLGPFAKKFLKGTLVYQRSLKGAESPSGNLYARGFAIEGETLKVANEEWFLGKEDMFPDEVKDCAPP